MEGNLLIFIIVLNGNDFKTKYTNLFFLQNNNLFYIVYTIQKLSKGF